MDTIKRMNHFSTISSLLFFLLLMNVIISPLTWCLNLLQFGLFLGLCIFWASELDCNIGITKRMYKVLLTMIEDGHFPTSLRSIIVPNLNSYRHFFILDLVDTLFLDDIVGLGKILLFFFTYDSEIVCVWFYSYFGLSDLSCGQFDQ